MKEEKKSFYTLSADPVFKNVFYRDDKLLKRFLSDILSNFYDNLVIDKIKIQNTEIPKDRIYIKNKTVDILVDIGDKIINCEVNVTYDEETEFRNFFYLIQSTVQDVRKATNYVDVEDHIQLNINFMKDNAYGFEISEYTNITRGINKISFVRTIDINVDYFKDTWYNLVGRKKEEYYDKYKSIIMFSFDEQQLKSLKDDDEYMKKIQKDVTELNQDPEFYQWLTDEEDREFLYNSRVIRYKREGLEEGISQGIEQGSKEKEIEIVRNMQEKNYPIEDIKEITGLSIEEINEIISKQWKQFIVFIIHKYIYY